MNEDVTKKLTSDEKLDLLLSEMKQMKTEIGQTKAIVLSVESRLTALETRVEDRLKDTRPIWQAIRAETEKLVQQYAQLDERLGRVEEQNAQIIQQQSQFDERLSSVEEQNKHLIQQNTEFGMQLHKFGEKIDTLVEDVYEVRAENRYLRKRISALEEQQAV
ncbi:MAG: hypothetical protein ABI977_23095 [Acidobacteriota bacterium]